MSASPIPDRLLLEQAAFLRALACRLVRDPEAAEDLVQETWVRALQRPPRLPGALRSWLARVFRNLAANRGRDRERRDRRESAAVPPPDESTPEEILAHREELEQLVQALHELDEPDYLVVHLRYFEGLPLAEIARRLDLRPDTAKARLRRALEKIRCSLDRRHGGNRSRWLSALAPLARLPRGAPAAVGGGLAGVVLPVGVLAMSLKAKVSLVAVCLLLGGIGSWALLAPPGFLSPGKGGGLGVPVGEARTGRKSDPGQPASAAGLEDESAGARKALPPAGPEPGPGHCLDLLAILVVDQTTGRPVPGAEVLVLHEGQGAVLDRTEVWLCHGADLESWLRKNAAHHVTDGQGRLQIPCPRNGWIFAKQGDKAALRVVEGWKGERRICLELAPSAALEVEVVDEAGKPRESVPMALLLEDWRCPVLTAATGAAGRALFPQAHLLAREAARKGKSLVLGFAFPLAAPVEQPVRWDEFPARPIRMVLPPTGRVVVEVQGLDGRPVEGDALAVLDPGLGPALGVGDRGREKRRGYAGGRAFALVKGGRALFPHAGLGLSLRVRVIKGDLGWAAAEAVAVGPGPTIEGEEVSFWVTFESPGAVLAGRAVDVKGKPVAGRSLGAAVIARNPEGLPWTSHGNGQTGTDAEGRFRLRLPGGGTEGAEFLVLTARLPDEGGWRTAAGRAGIAGLAAGRIRELGDVVLSPAPLLAAGRVVDEKGAAVPYAHVQVREVQDGNPVFPYSDDRSDLGSSCDGRGEFSIHGYWEQGPLELGVFLDGYGEGRATIVAAGTRGIVLCLARRGGILGGRLVVDPEIRVEELDVHVIGFEEGGGSLSAFVVKDGRFQGEVQPGSYSLEVRIGSEADPVVRIEKVEVEAGEKCRDPRLEAIDLRGRVRCFKITCRDEAGSPVRDAVALFPPFHPPLPFDYQMRRGGPGIAAVHTSQPAVDLQVRAPGFRPFTLAGVMGDREVVLERCLPLRMVLVQGVGDLVPEPNRLLVLLRSSPGLRNEKGSLVSFQPWREADGTFTLQGEARVSAFGPGTWWLEWMVVRYRDVGELVGMTVPEKTPQSIQVSEAPGEQVFRLSAPRAEIADTATRLIARLKK